MDPRASDFKYSGNAEEVTHLSYELAEIANKAKPRLLVIYHCSPLNRTLLEPVLAMRKGANRELVRVRQKSDGTLLEEIKKTYMGKVMVAHDLDIF